MNKYSLSIEISKKEEPLKNKQKQPSSKQITLLNIPKKDIILTYNHSKNQYFINKDNKNNSQICHIKYNPFLQSYFLKKFYINPHENQKNSLFIEVPYTQDYEIKEGDYLKIGKITFFISEVYENNASNQENEENSYENSDRSVIKLKKIHNENQINNSHNNKPNITTNESYYNQINQDLNSKKHKSINVKPPLCRYCLLQEEDLENPLIKICICMGSVALTHVDCIKKWLYNKVNLIKNESILLVYYKILKCEICNSDLSDCFIVNGRRFSIFFDNNRDESYVIMKYIGNNNTKFLYKIGFHLNYLILGRSNKCNVCIKDFSISREHAIISLYNNRFYIKDLQSKYGTFIRVNSEFDGEGKGLYICIMYILCMYYV